ncbi:MAG TPA: TlpA disulfide reductase family protein [Phycisphaerae bacterium]|nr:TlpA disulfide reductase family protein [Phycisphaerae bacterium]
MIIAAIAGRGIEGDPGMVAWAQETRPAEPTLPAGVREGDAQGLFLTVLRQVESAKTVAIEGYREVRSAATEPVKIARHRPDTDYVSTLNFSIALARPGELKESTRFRSDPAALQTRTFSLFDRGIATLGTFQNDKGGWVGRSGELKRATVDDVLRGHEVMVWAYTPEMAWLLDSEGEQRFFKFATGWQWIGEASDEDRKVWRVSVVEPSEEHWRWQAWITEGATPALTRLIVTANTTTAVIEADADGSNSKSWTYNVAMRNETVFTKWDLTTPIPAEAFARPAGNYRTAKYADNARPRVGDVVPVPQLSDVTGAAVDLSKRRGAIVLDFWFSNCPPCMKETPEVEKVVKEFGGKVPLYGINGMDAPQVIAATAAKQGWNGIVNLVDVRGKYGDAMKVDGWPTVMVIGADGKLLYRDYPGEPAALGRLKDVLDRATRPLD